MTQWPKDWKTVTIVRSRIVLVLKVNSSLLLINYSDAGCQQSCSYSYVGITLQMYADDEVWVR
jgi:hypothetical protein